MSQLRKGYRSDYLTQYSSGAVLGSDGSPPSLYMLLSEDIAFGGFDASIKDGAIGSLLFQQDGAGGHTVDFQGLIYFVGDKPFDLTPESYTLIDVVKLAGVWVGTIRGTVLGEGAEPPITPGTTNDYWRGDKTWQPFDASAVISALTYTPIDAATLGQPLGPVPLNGSGVIASSYLPSYVDDVIEVANYAALPGTGETGKIYVVTDTNTIFRWTGSVYVEIVASPGSTDSVTEGSINLYFTEDRVRATPLTGLSLLTNAAITAADTVLSSAGKLQKQFTDHFNNASNPHSVTKSQVGLGNVDNTTDLAKPISTLTQAQLDLKTPRTSTTGSTVLPVGTTGQRDGSPSAGLIRYNTTLSQFEGYGSGWGTIGGGATGGVGNAAFYENDQIITADYTITAGKNAGSFGPITIATGVTVTIPTGSTWSIV